MTTMTKEKVKCAVCGAMSEHSMVMSTNSFGSPDLDMRPPEMKRSTVNTWIQACPSCGYCAPDISKMEEGAADLVAGESYKLQLNSPEFPELANRFLCFSMIQESAGEYVDAAWPALHAAWVCDDKHSGEGAKKCREKAAALFQKARENGQKFTEETGAEEAILTDILRRSGQFEIALETSNEGLKKGPEKIVSGILEFQKELISKEDTGRHIISETIKRK